MENKELQNFEKSLGTFKVVEPDPKWLASLRFRIVGDIPGHRKETRSNYRWALPITILLIIISLGGGSLALADNSLPGEPFYPIKRGVEEIRFNFADQEFRIQLQQEFTNERIDELRKLASKGKANQIKQAFEEVETSIQRTSKTISEASNESGQLNDTLENISLLVEKQQEELERTDELLPETLDKDIQILQDSLEGIKNNAEEKLNNEPEQEEDNNQSIEDNPSDSL